MRYLPRFAFTRGIGEGAFVPEFSYIITNRSVSDVSISMVNSFVKMPINRTIVSSFRTETFNVIRKAKRFDNYFHNESRFKRLSVTSRILEELI
jgi:hypothetical protein